MELRGIVLGDRYLLESRIAAGGMGQVWLAVDQVLGRLVAVKLLRPEYAEHPETLERFRAEARHAGVLNHPHIAQVYDYGPPEGGGAAFPAGGRMPSREPYLVMEYVDGPSLAEVIEREPLTADFTCDVIAQAAAGLDAAHQAGLVHRDIKPGNLLLTSDGRVKVTDFGIAHAAGSAPITAPGIVMGTSLYMAPERIAGGPGTPASDLYSLGIVMWECLMGRTPFGGASPDVMAAHLHQALPPLPGWVPAAVCELVARLTAKDPGYRLSDAGLLTARLRSMELVGAGSRARTLSGYADEQGGTMPWRPAAEGFTRSLGPARDLVSPARDLVSAARDLASAATDLVSPAVGYPGASVPVAAATGPARRDGRRQGVAAAVATVAVAGLVAGGLAASGAFGATRMAQQGPAGPASAARATSPGTLAYVQVPSFHGQRYATVARWLSGHGLAELIAWDYHAGLPAGTVVSVSPGGRVMAGSTVTVTVAWSPGEPLPTAIPSGQPGAMPSTRAPSAGASPTATNGDAQTGAATWPGAGSSPGTSPTAPAATQPATSAPPPGGHGTSQTPSPTPSCAVPVGPVCF